MNSYPQVSINTDLSDSLCFGCGQNNPIGLKLTFSGNGEGVRGEFTAGKQYQGWPGIVHGGILGCILDEAMSHLAHAGGRECVTARMEIRFRQPAPVEQPMIITSRLIRNTRRLIETAAQICLRDGTLLAEGSALQFVVSSKRQKAGGNA